MPHRGPYGGNRRPQAAPIESTGRRASPAPDATIDAAFRTARMPPNDDSPPAAPRRATLRQAFGAVFWGFFGVRKGRLMQRDAVSLRPQQVIVAGVVMAAAFVAILVVVVRLIVRAAG